MQKSIVKHVLLGTLLFASALGFTACFQMPIRRDSSQPSAEAKSEEPIESAKPLDTTKSSSESTSNVSLDNNSLETLFTSLAEENKLSLTKTQLNKNENSPQGLEAESQDGSRWKLFVFSSEDEANSAYETVMADFEKQKEAIPDCFINNSDQSSLRTVGIQSKEADLFLQCIMQNNFIFIMQGGNTDKESLYDFTRIFMNSIPQSESAAEDGVSGNTEENVARAQTALKTFAKNHNAAKPTVQKGTIGFSGKCQVTSVAIDNNDYELIIYVFNSAKEVKSYLNDAETHFSQTGYVVTQSNILENRSVEITRQKDNDNISFVQYDNFLLQSSGKDVEKEREEIQELLNIFSD